MRIGYLHLGNQKHGVVRFGKQIASGLKQSANVDVYEWLLDEWHSNIIKSIKNIDILHCQYNAQVYSSIWGRLFHQNSNLNELFNLVKIPVVFTIHDIYRPGYITEGNIFKLSDWLKMQFAPQRFALKKIIDNSSNIIVNSKEEATRLVQLNSIKPPSIIHHYIEQRELKESKINAKSHLGLKNRKTILILGYIHPRKGHDLLIDAMRYLPKEYYLIIAGDAVPSQQNYKNTLINSIKTFALSDRIRITGYLTDSKLEIVLTATDLAALPCRNVSASGSLNTVISAGVPVIASDLPLFHEYNSIVNHSITILPKFDSYYLAKMIQEMPLKDGEMEKRLVALKNHLSIKNTAKKYLDVYQESI
jgi:glycosyltransferase involved in cell wall biosynthesis